MEAIDDALLLSKTYLLKLRCFFKDLSSSRCCWGRTRTDALTARSQRRLSVLRASVRPRSLVVTFLSSPLLRFLFLSFSSSTSFSLVLLSFLLRLLLLALLLSITRSLGRLRTRQRKVCLADDANQKNSHKKSAATTTILADAERVDCVSGWPHRRRLCPRQRRARPAC